MKKTTFYMEFSYMCKKGTKPKLVFKIRQKIYGFPLFSELMLSLTIL